jgi:hypothetical protein
MAAKDKFHLAVRHALEKDGWVITHDPYVLEIFVRRQKVDLGAEKVFAAEKESEKIAVEVKSFLGPSLLDDFYDALGKYISYSVGIGQQEPSRVLYLAIPRLVFEAFEQTDNIQAVLQIHQIRLIIFEPTTETILSWET